MKTVADFLKSVRSPQPPAVHKGPIPRKQTTTMHTEARVAAAAIHSTSSAVEIYETPKRRPDDDDDVDDDGDDVAYGGFVEEEGQKYGRKQFGAVARPYLTPKLYKRSFPDTRYGLRKDSNTFMIGDSPLTVDNDSDVTIKGKCFRGTQGLWELLTCRKVQLDIITTDDLKAYKKTLLLSNSHLTGYEPDGNINVSRVAKFQKVVSRLFPLNRKQRAIESTLRLKWAKY